MKWLQEKRHIFMRKLGIWEMSDIFSENNEGVK